MVKKVIIYTSPTCVYCRMAREFFREHNVHFTEHDVTKDEKKVEEMQEKSHQLGVPVIDIDGEIIVGFDRGAIARALGI